MKKQENKSCLQVMRCSIQFILDISTTTGSHLSNKRGHFDDPYQVKQCLKNKKRKLYGFLSTIFIGAGACISSSIHQLFSSGVNYLDAKIKTQMIVNSAQELKKHGLDYSPEALTKYGIISAKKENCHNDPDEDNRLMKILQNILNIIHNKFYTRMCSVY